MRQPDNIITAIDVQPNSLSLVSLVLQGRSLHLNGAASQVLPAGVIESGNWRNPGHMYKALRQGCAALGAPVKTVVLSIATDAVITSDLMLPKSLFAPRSSREFLSRCCLHRAGSAWHQSNGAATVANDTSSR